MTDVLIAGGGVAGSALAIMLGRCGVRVELFERGQFPKEKPCGEGLMPAGVAVLRRLGLSQEVGGTPFRGVRYHFEDQSAEGAFPQAGAFPVWGLGQRRKVLDQALFEAAANTPGVVARTAAVVSAPLMKNGRVVGLLVNGKQHRAALTVAADGVHSRIRHALGLAAPVRRPRVGIRAHFRLPNGKQQAAWVEVFLLRRGGEVYVAPLPEGEMLVAFLVDARRLTGSAEVSLRQAIASLPALAGRLEGAEQITRALAISPLVGRARPGVTRGAVLLGDAAGSIDPITGGGMTHALVTAELLAHHVLAQTGGDAWLGQFERERKALLRDYRALTQTILWIADHPLVARMAVAALAFSPHLFSHFAGVAGGMRRLLPFATKPVTLRTWPATARPAAAPSTFNVPPVVLESTTKTTAAA